MVTQTAKRIIWMLNLESYQKRYIYKQLQDYGNEVPDDIFFAIIEDGSVLEEYDVIIIWQYPLNQLTNVKIIKLYKLLSNWKWYDEYFEEIDFKKLNWRIMDVNKEKKLLIVFNY